MAELNLIPSSMKKKSYEKNKRLSMLFLVIIAFAVLFFAFYIPFIILQDLQDTESTLRLQINAQNNVIEERKLMTSQMETTKELISLVDNFDKSRKSINQYITDLQSMIPSDIDCTVLDYADNVLSITGTAMNQESPAVFVANLQETENYKNANLINITAEADGYKFDISIKLMP